MWGARMFLGYSRPEVEVDGASLLLDGAGGIRASVKDPLSGPPSLSHMIRVKLQWDLLCSPVSAWTPETAAPQDPRLGERLGAQPRKSQ